MKSPLSLRRQALAGMSRADEVVPVMMIDLADIAPDPNQPRKTFSEESLQELAASMILHKQQIPLKVRENPEGVPPFLIKDGERRWRAANLRPDEIPQLMAIKETTEEDARTRKIRQFIINDKSEGMSFEDQARLFKELLADGRTKVEDIAVALSISPNRIYKVIQAESATGLAGEARDSGLSNDPETLNAIAALEKKDPDGAAALVEKGKATGKITRKEVRDKAATSKTNRQAPAKIEAPGASAKEQGAATATTVPVAAPSAKPAIRESVTTANGLPVIFVRFEGTDEEDAELFALRAEGDGEAFLCLTQKHEDGTHAYVAFGSEAVVEAFPLASLRFDRIVIKA